MMWESQAEDFKVEQKKVGRVRLPDVVQLDVDVVGPQDELQGGVIIKTLQNQLL